MRHYYRYPESCETLKYEPRCLQYVRVITADNQIFIIYPAGVHSSLCLEVENTNNAKYVTETFKARDG